MTPAVAIAALAAWLALGLAVSWAVGVITRRAQLERSADRFPELHQP